MHEFGTRRAVNSSVVALQHPVVLLVGASGDGSAVARIGVCAFVALAHDGPHEEEKADKGRCPKDPPDELDDDRND